MTPQEAYEKRYAHIDNGRHTWDVAPQHVKDMWLAAWEMAEATERKAICQLADDMLRGVDALRGRLGSRF